MLPCTDSLLAYNATSPLQYYVVFTNQLGSVIYLPPNAINVTFANVGGSRSYHLGNCNPNLAGQGVSVLCSASMGANLKQGPNSAQVVDFILNYSLCTTNNMNSCSTNFYKSSGYSMQNIAPAGINVDRITFVTKPGSSIVINGVAYFNNTYAYMSSGNYVIFAQPAPGAAFNSISWTVNSPSRVAASLSQNTTLVLNSNTVLRAQFN